MLTHYLVAVGLLTVTLGLVSRHLHAVPVTEPLIGLLYGIGLGPHALGLLEVPGFERDLLLELSHVLLGFTVMTAALRYPFGEVRTRVRPVAVMLLGVLPAMAVSSALIAKLSFDVSWSSAVLLGAILSPTDPVLASSTVSGRLAERHLPAVLRQTLTLESGANDGLAFVFVTVGLYLTADRSSGWLTAHTLGSVSGGLALGIAAGWFTARAESWSRGGERQTEGTFLLFTLTFSVFVLGLSRLAQLDGILAVFVAGLVYNRGVGEDIRTSQSAIEEGVDRLLMLPVFVLLGVALPWGAWLDLGWPAASFVVAMLLLRRLPFVLASGRALQMSRPSLVWLGWFGPIGVAAIYYAAHADAEGASASGELWAVVTLMVAASTVVHGATAVPAVWRGVDWMSDSSSEQQRQ